jgi:uncharacterized RmlC-like cupin family protein
MRAAGRRCRTTEPLHQRESEEQAMSGKLRVVTSDELEAGPSTAGMRRSQAFATDNLWFGEVHTRPGEISGWHHHGEHTTHGYVVSGRVRFDFGPDGAEHAEAGPGEYFTVPPHSVHREQNPGTEEQVIVLVRSGTGPTVTNVNGPATA